MVTMRTGDPSTVRPYRGPKWAPVGLFKEEIAVFPRLRSLRHSGSLLAACLLLVLSGCPADDDDDSADGPDPTPTPVEIEPSVIVSGDYAVQAEATLQLTATTADGTDSSYTWASNDEIIATVDADGLVTGLVAGTAMISATGADTGALGEHPVVVTALPIDPDPIVSVSGDFWVVVGDTIALTAATANGTDASYTWMVDDEATASVDADGNLTGHFAGNVVVTATGDDTGASDTMGVVVTAEVPNFSEWANSPHADASAEAFIHWDEDGAVPASCARCHSTPGFQDYIGADGSEAGVVDQDAALGTVIECQACHNEVADNLDAVTFPSGEVVENLGASARCMTCHQGRSSSDTVEQAITDAAVADDDTVSADLGFINIHYYAAGATLMAGLARGGYQYDGQIYDVRFRHVDDLNACVECHSPHTLEVDIASCATCHEGVTTIEDLHDVRMMSSATSDYDGDGDLDEGIYDELEGLREALYATIQAYATQEGAPICYDSHAYPYFFGDTDGSGVCEEAEANYGNRYASWTARLLRGAYNFQVASKDPGAFAHNAKYMIELLYDSNMDMNAGLDTPIDYSATVRNDPGHFNGSSEAARHWDEDEAVSASCSKCHGGSAGFNFYLDHGVGNAVLEQGNGLECETCHATLGDVADPADAYALTEVEDFALQSGETFSIDTEDGSNLCATCHSGRKTGADVQARIDSGSLSFQNVHYLPAAGVRLGGDGHIGYEYGVNAYDGAVSGHLAGDSCSTCHDAVVTEHTFDAHVAYEEGECAPCHDSAGSLAAIRMSGHDADYDGDGDASETLAGELETMAAALLVAMHDADGLCYDSHAYPYFFTGGDADGHCLPGEGIYPNRFQAFTEASIAGSYNYQVWAKDPGAWAHNFGYIAQLLYDSYEANGGDPVTDNWVRPGDEL